MRLSLLFFASLCILGYLCCAQRLCGETDSQSSNGYTFSNNIWNKDENGFSCSQLSDNRDRDNRMTVTWQWDPARNEVHAYPNIDLQHSELPMLLGNVSRLNIASHWGMRAASSSSSSDFADAASLANISCIANVALDCWVDEDATVSMQSTKQKYEVMIWLGHFGGAAAIGSSRVTKEAITYKLQNTTFTLHIGKNQRGQIVYSWVADSLLPDFEGDVAPLFEFLWRHALVPYPAYLGVVQFGSEQYTSTAPVAFSIQQYHASIEPLAVTGNGKTVPSSIKTDPLPAAQTQVAAAKGLADIRNSWVTLLAVLSTVILLV